MSAVLSQVAGSSQEVENLAEFANVQVAGSRLHPSPRPATVKRETSDVQGTQMGLRMIFPLPRNLLIYGRKQRVLGRFREGIKRGGESREERK